jgi:hypothetical protein
MVTVRPRALSRAAMEAAARPFPNEDKTPPVTKINFVVIVISWAEFQQNIWLYF